MDPRWDTSLVECLFERLMSKLPHKTRATQQDLAHDEVLNTTHATIVSLSVTSITLVLEYAVGLLNDLIPSPNNPVEGHVLQSQIYVSSLIADCCSANWDAVRAKNNSDSAHIIPDCLDEELVSHIFDAVRLLLDPFPDNFVLPSNTLLSANATNFPRALESRVDELYDGVISEKSNLEALRADMSKLDENIKTLLQFVSASSWSSCFEYSRVIVYALRAVPTTGASSTSQQSTMKDDERAAAIFLRCMSFFWIDGAKLGTVMSEIASTYLHLKPQLKNCVAVVMPILITNWIDRFPDEFVHLHIHHVKLSGAIEMLFDMCHSETVKIRQLYVPMQASLLLLLPEVFEVVSSLTTVKSSAKSKRVVLLDNLKKAIRNKNQYACFCLVMLLRAGRHFVSDNDSAFSSFALDIQDEIRDAVFRNFSGSSESPFLDQDMITASLVALAHLDVDGVAESLLESCLIPSAPLSFKLAVVQACQYFASLPNHSQYRPLFNASAPFIYAQLRAISNGKTSAVLPDSSSSELSPNKAVAAMAQGIMGFLKASNGLMLYQSSIDNPDETNLFRSLIFCLVSTDREVRKLAADLSCSLFDDSPEAKERRPGLEALTTCDWHEDYWRRSANTLMSICSELDKHTSQARLQHLEHNLTARVLVLQEFPILSKLERDIPEMATAASQIETTLLLLLCAVDINVCQLVTSCIGLFLQESILLLNTSGSGYQTSLMRNRLVFDELASKDFRFTGLVAFQKRTRGLFRRLHCPTPGIIYAWEIAFERWIQISRDVSASSLEPIADTTLTKWRNYSGMLASVGGICTAERSATLDEPTMSSNFRWIDRTADQQDEPSLLRYLRLSIKLLACSNIRVREATREVLSTEISPFLYQQLFTALSIELDVLFNGNLTPNDRAVEREIIFAEQAASLIRTLVERLETPADAGAAASVHLGAMTLNFAKFMEGVVDNSTTIRVKIKICQLCELVAHRKEFLNLRDDVQVRNQLLEYVFSWISRPKTPRPEAHLSSRHDESSRMQKDLDKACLKCLSELTYRLPLQPTSSDGQSDAGASELKSQLFQTYFNRFLSLLNHDNTETRRMDLSSRDDHLIPDLSITILSNLLSSNIDVGLKHSLNIGYHENLEIRTAFVKVLYNILIQGTEFSNLSDTAVSEKHTQLLDILTSDVSLAVALSVVCPANEVDEMAISLLVVYEQRGKGFQLIEALISQEIDDTDSEAEILRRNCVATKLLSIYAKWQGSAYLKATLQKVVERLMITSKELNLELDPSRVTSAEELQNNAIQLRIVAKVFVDDICASSANIPPCFRKICSIISSAVLPRFPDAKYTAVGAFIFLRFFCPAIVAPDVEGIISNPPSKEMRRGLLLIAKVVQNLANNVLFGAKEPFMFPLNDFLTENIYRVTTFLREISGSPMGDIEPSSAEWSEFGSCVSLHRFLYDHWDHFRQRLTYQERREQARSPAESQRTRSPFDGMPIVCIIMRYIDVETVDYDAIIYWYLKIVSRLWSRPFGLLIDATCYNGHVETPEDLFERLEKLSPVELSRSLSRVYIHNMNSTFRSCLRRLLRASSRNRGSVFNPNNVHYHLLGGRYDLQAHFHLSQLNLPKETISVVTDTRFVFQPVTKLSRMRGDIDVTITVGTYFIQVTTNEKQEVHSTSRISGIVNDTFRVGEVEDMPSSMGLDDDSGFGLRADNGKFVMQFKSSKTTDIIQAIRGTKAKNGKDNRSQKMFERLVRPQDVPGTLLNLALTNLSSPDHTLRLASYNLLGALCRAFKFASAGKLLCLKGISIPMVPASFVLRISTELATTEPQLTQDFLTEFFVGWDSFSEDQRPLSMAYMAPWLPGLRIHILTNETDGEKAREKVAIILRKLVDVAMSDHLLTFTLEKTVWPHISRDEVLVEILLEELTRTALKISIQDSALEALASIAASIGTVTIRGKIIARLRKVLNRSSMRPTRHLPDNSVWGEICILLRFCLSLSFDSGVQAQLYLPDIFHIVTMLANTGPPDVRSVVHRLLINSLHSISTSFSLNETQQTKLLSTLEYLDEPRSELFLLLTATRDGGASFTTAQEQGVPSLNAVEALANLLIEVCAISAPNLDAANTWRARWMSLVASTAFQVNPAIQPKAFTIMGCLAQGDVDDDLLYQVLVSLGSSITRYCEDGIADLLVSIVTALSKMMTKLPSTSRYGLQLFWLAISMLRFLPSSLFNYAAQLLEAFLNNVYLSENMTGQKLIPLLLQARSQLKDACFALDETHGIPFTPDNFHFAVCACLVRGLTDTMTRTTTMRVLSVFLDVMEPAMPSASEDSEGSGSNASMKITTQSPYAALMLSRCVGLEELNDRLWFPGINPQTMDDSILQWRLHDLDSVKDKDLLLNTCIELVDFQDLDAPIQNRSLRWLTSVALRRPSVIIHLYSHLTGVLDDILYHSQISSTLQSAYELLQCLITNPKFATANSQNVEPYGVLIDLGFSKIWQSCSYNSNNEPDPEFAVQLKDLINLIIL
ncbi:Ras GTPase activating protein ira2 [Ceratocystis pirilliformis]|uniref:Ras GTPase activating protein ira2 n=1 Tax=Ceratocystis pirilliformis TaxID=259994 RepID=A0ABR3ZC24_9PEZI